MMDWLQRGPRSSLRKPDLLLHVKFWCPGWILLSVGKSVSAWHLMWLLHVPCVVTDFQSPRRGGVCKLHPRGLWNSASFSICRALLRRRSPCEMCSLRTKAGPARVSAPENRNTWVELWICSVLRTEHSACWLGNRFSSYMTSFWK